MPARKTVIFYLNGVRCEAGPDQARLMLADYLRVERNLTGTKIVCAEGDCGACTVLRLARDPANPKKKLHLPINSCIVTVAQMDGSSLVTVDALAGEKNDLSPVQHAMVHAHGSQCGFCTPGFVMALTGLVEKKICSGSARPAACTIQEAKNATTGNLCRCTGYQPILDAAVAVDLKKCDSVAARYSSRAQELELEKIRKQAVELENERFSFYAPRTVREAARYLTRHRDARLVAASTDLGVVANKGKLALDRLVSLHLIPDLFEIKETAGKISVGARVTLSELRQFAKKRVPEFARFLDLFASPQIKNLATLVGNVGNASPIADTPPFLLVANAVITLQGARGARKVPIDEFYLGYRKTALKRDELIAKIEFEMPKKSELLRLYKVSQRKDLDICAVNAAFRVSWSDEKRTKLKDIRIAMGGIAATPLRLKKTETRLKKSGVARPEDFLNALATLHGEMEPLSDLRGTSAFRRVLVENLFLKFARELAS